MKIKFKYGEYDNCSLQFNKYFDGSNSLTIFDADGFPLINVTKCLSDCRIEPNQILVKDYSENEGILDCLIENNIIEDTGLVCPNGFVKLHICNLLVDPKDYK